MTAPAKAQNGVAKPEAGTAVATQEAKQHPIAVLLQSAQARQYIEPFLPQGVSIERVVATAVLAVRDNPDLAKCDQGSVVRAVARIQSWNLEIGTTAYLMPFNTKVKLEGGGEEYRMICKPVAGYTGLAELMIGSGAVRHVSARCVFEKDAFEYEQGLSPRLVHVPCGDVKSRGKLIGAYCILRLPFGRSEFEYMPLDDIDKIRKDYSKQWAKGDCPPWYAKKTVVRQVAKLVPKNPRLAKALRVIEEDELAEFEVVREEQRRALSRGVSHDDEDTGPMKMLDEGEDYREDERHLADE